MAQNAVTAIVPSPSQSDNRKALLETHLCSRDYILSCAHKPRDAAYHNILIAVYVNGKIARGREEGAGHEIGKEGVTKSSRRGRRIVRNSQSAV